MSRLAALLTVTLVLAGCASSDDSAEAPGAVTESRRDLVEVPDRGEASVRADLDLGLGVVTVGEAEPGALFQAEVVLPIDGLRADLRTETVPTESGPQARIRLRLDGEGASPGDLDRTRALAWRLLFSHQTPLDLSVRMGAAEADLDLTGVPLRRLMMVCGVARTSLRLRAPNPDVAAEVDIKAGVSEFTAEGLGHLRARRLRFEGGVGRFALDFRGAPPEPGAEATLRVGVGELDVMLPEGVPVVVEAPGGRLSAVEMPAGLVTLGQGRFATPGAGPDAFTVRIASGPGRVRVRLGGPLPPASPPAPPAPPDPPLPPAPPMPPAPPPPPPPLPPGE
ncbi:MAG TPA: hypothetical protein VF594_09525 [Rubricoccaceae bacterium]